MARAPTSCACAATALPTVVLLFAFLADDTHKLTERQPIAGRRFVTTESLRNHLNVLEHSVRDESAQALFAEQRYDDVIEYLGSLQLVPDMLDGHFGPKSELVSHKMIFDG
jgi:hypothetical protein